MKLSRRRFLITAATAAVAGGLATGTRATPVPVIWRGRALGAEAKLRIYGGTVADTEAALQAARDTLQRMETLFSLYDASSALVRLNKTGEIKMPPEFARLVQMADRAHHRTDRLFDPTVQPLMSALAKRGPDLKPQEIAALSKQMGWHQVDVTARRIRFRQPGMAITFNGIAQGFATDRVAEVLAAYGFEETLVNIGEYRAGRTPMRIGIADIEGSILEATQLQSGALATSSPDRLRFSDGSGHIQRADGRNLSLRWRTVSVEAGTAAMADAYSTALVLTPDIGLAERLKSAGHVRSVLMQENTGEIWRI